MPVDVRLFALLRPPDEVSALAQLLSQEERAREARLRRAEHRRRFVVARGTLRCALAETLGCGAGEVVLTLGAHGKPEVDRRVHPGGPRFSVSHSEELLAVALHPSREVGVDVEVLRAIVDPPAFSERVLTPGERRWVLAADPPERPRRLLRVWTRKEAIVKAQGRGLEHAPASLDASRATVWAAGVAYEIHDLPHAAGHVGAVALAHSSV